MMQQENKTLLIKNLDSKVTEESLKSILELISPLTQIKIIKDNDNNDANCGLVEFYEARGAEQALHTMDKRTIYSKEISVNWCDETPSDTSRRSSTQSEESVILNNVSYEEIFAQTPLYNTSILIKKLPNNFVSQDIVPYLQQYGSVSDIRLKNNEAIVKLDTHANAAMAIFALQGQIIKNHAIQLDWLKTATTPSFITPISRSNSQENLHTPFYCQPKTALHQLKHTFENQHKTSRPPAPTMTESLLPNHGWNQYYQQYYSAGHLTI